MRRKVLGRPHAEVAGAARPLRPSSRNASRATWPAHAAVGGPRPRRLAETESRRGVCLPLLLPSILVVAPRKDHKVDAVLAGSGECLTPLTVCLFHWLGASEAPPWNAEARPWWKLRPRRQVWRQLWRASPSEAAIAARHGARRHPGCCLGACLGSFLGHKQVSCRISSMPHHDPGGGMGGMGTGQELTPKQQYRQRLAAILGHTGSVDSADGCMLSSRATHLLLIIQ